MRISAAVAVAALLGLSGCDSRVNPVNWFGERSAEPTIRPAAVEEEVRVDPRPLVDRVTRLTVEPVPGGALVTATGLPPTQGWFRPELVPERVAIDDRPIAQDGILTLRFVAVPPPRPARSGPARSREIEAGLFLSGASLDGVRSVTVRGASESRSARP